MIDIDIIGTLYGSSTPSDYLDDAGMEYNLPPVALPGYHVNATAAVAGWESFKVMPTTPRRVFGGHSTHFYTFADRAEYETHLATADLSVPTAMHIPNSLTRAQAKLALLNAGLLDAVQPAIDAVPDPAMRQARQIEWDDRLTFDRGNPTLIALAAGLGMTSAQLDQLFIAGIAL